MSAESVFGRAIRACEALPAEVRNAQFTYIKERRIDRSSLGYLESQSATAAKGSDLSAQVARRRQALRPYFGHNLICGYVRLPGVYYTIEVDPKSECVVHWEWDDTLAIK